MIRKNAKVFALVLAIVMMLSTAAFAAEGDHFVNGKLKYSANQVRADVSAKNHVRVAPSEFQIEVEGKLYDLADANAAYEEDKANWKEILKGEDPSEDLKVVEVSAITKTGVTVKLEADADDTKAADKASYTVKVGTEEVTVTSVVYTAATKTAVLNVQLDGKAGIVSVNDKAAKDEVDYEKPTIQNVQALNNKNIVATFSEKLDSTAGANSAIANFAVGDPVKYTLYNKTNGTSVRLTSDANANTVQVTATFANVEKTKVQFNIVSVGANVTGFPNDGLANGGYILYVSNVNDAATPANTIVSGSPYEFAGTLTPDTAAPKLLSSSFNNASGLVTLVFDKPTTGAAPADDKVYFQVGTEKVLLKNATDYTSIAGTSTVTFTVNTTAGTGTLAKINALGSNPKLVLEAGAFTDGNNTTEAATVTPEIVTAPILKQVTYNENTNTVVYKFSKTIDVSKITGFAGAKFNLGGVDIEDANLKFNNTGNSTDLSFTLSDDKAQAVETALRSGTLTATVAANTVQDTETTPNKNVTVSSNATLEAGTTYIKDEVAPTLVSSKYNGDSKVLELTFDEPIRNTIGDFVAASVEFYKDDNGVPGIQTTVVNGVPADTKIATFADTDLSAATNEHGILQAGLVKDVTGAPAATAGSESSTIYVKDSDLGAEKLHDTLDAVAAGTDIYVNILAGGVKDPSGNAIKEAQTVKIEKVAVSNASAVTSATTTTVNTNASVTVEFKNGNGPVVMDETTATNPDNYDIYLTANPLSKAQIESITMNATNTEATIVFSTPLVASAGYSYTTSGIKTAAGEAGDIVGDTTIPAETFTTGAAADTIVLTAVQNVELTDVDKSGTVSAGDTIKLTFNEEVKLPAGFSASDITVSGSRSLGNSAVSLSADKKTLTITVGSSATIKPGDTLTFPTTIKDYEGNALVVGNVTSNAMTVKGNVAPKILSALYEDTNADGKVSTGDKLVVKFNQNVRLDDNKTLTDILDDIVESGTDFTAATISGDTVTLTVGTAAFSVGDNVDVNGTPGNVDLVNSWGTKVVPTAKAIAAIDKVAPTVTGISYKASTNELTFSFSEAVNIDTQSVDADSLAAALAAKLTANGGDLGSTFTAAALSADYKSVTITLDGNEALDQYTTISIAAGIFGDATDNVQDASGNVAVRGQDRKSVV